MNARFSPVIPVAEDELMVSSGLAAAIDCLAWIIYDKGDGILVPRPFYAGSTTIPLTAAETWNPRVATPGAAKRVFWRVLILCVVTILMVGMIVPSDNPKLLGQKSTAS
ncbi:hypothetical protein B0J13DRAFT_530384 [Dactylonectria estremocensis]|uniref:Amino acid permease/ SLC12A domain-containing protein n=1 Tax=Dactylonectria estremocensis TaxID=1079267 RepID=A0A9P9E2M3_9HYPO|nr:hypothetical protein B0J13DRAFT_530384 [Dactylonectria estremocensis]